MMMFFSSDDHKLSKQEICDELWPKKPDASDTLYTLIKRIKPIIQIKGNLKIISERGKDYKLTVND
jgi:DNA-binding SARP family transcriptional activator